MAGSSNSTNNILCRRVFKYEFIDSGQNKQPEQRRGVFRTQLKSEGVYLRKFLTANSRNDTLS